MNQEKPATLLLADGTLFEGYSFGAQGTVIGEVVFNTNIVGFQEILTDPTYYGQIVAQTFPLVGCYGINSDDNESDHCQLRGYIVREHCTLPSNFRCETDLDAFLTAQNVVGLCGIDTRRLTRFIRDNGNQNGMITTEPITDLAAALEQIRTHQNTGAVCAVTCSQSKTYNPAQAGPYRLALVDFGVKRSFVQEWLSRGCTVTVFPSNTPAQEILACSPNGILLSEGPGDPRENDLCTVKALAQSGIPLLAVGLGHQLLACSQGASVQKLKHGHCGANQPVIDLLSQKTYITAQNHNYIVTDLPQTAGTVVQVNANDQTCEGIAYTQIPAISTQFAPHSCGCAQDTSYIIDQFMMMMNRR